MDETLGDDPFEYATRFRILDDRGVRRSMDADGKATSEYVVLAEVHVDAERVRERLQVVGSAGRFPRGTTRASASGSSRTGSPATSPTRPCDVPRSTGSERAFGGASRARAGAGSARGGRFDGDPDALLADLVAGAPPELRVVPLEASDGEIHVLIEWSEVPASDTGAGGYALNARQMQRLAIDTHLRNRY